MYHRSIALLLGAALLFTWVAGCSDGPSAASASDRFETEEQRTCAAFADRFAAALTAGDFAAAHAMGATHLKDSMTADDMASYERQTRAIFGAVVAARPAAGVTTDPEELAGAAYSADDDTELDRSLRIIGAARTIGDLPDSVPLSIRKASVTIEVVRDPRTIPDFESHVPIEEMTEDDLPITYLTIVVVEEDGRLGVAHYWYRWPDMLD